MISPASPAIASSFSSASTSFDGKRHLRHKGAQFIFKYGKRHHSYDNEKAPYPLSYDRQMLEIESLDNRLGQHLRGSVSFMNFEEHPMRVLDLGCGTGTWIIESAKEWPECEFVGFDLVNIQIPPKMLDPSIASRIEWRHGNFLTTKLPFDEDEFDHVHIRSIAKGVPENKWGVLFEEVNRVLRPGGSVEIIEDDVVFPVLPKWFTAALRARPRPNTSSLYSNGANHEYGSCSPLPHDHALLESLNKSVFEHRFINMTPTALLPSYFTTYFRQVTIGPVVTFPMPLLPPLLPLPSQVITSYVIEPNSDTLEKRTSTVSPATTFTRPMSYSFSSSISMASSSTAFSSSTSMSSKRPRTASASLSSPRNAFSSSSLMSTQIFENLSKDVLKPTFKMFMLDSSLDESDIAAFPQSLFPLEQLSALSERSLAMHLYRSYQSVLACQEAMWEELKDRIRNRREELVPFGWEDDEELEELQNRKKFEKLIERYRTDMQTRISLWCSLSGMGWPLPTREPLSRAELIEEERIRENMQRAYTSASLEEVQSPCRTVRVLVGYKL